MSIPLTLPEITVVRIFTLTLLLLLSACSAAPPKPDCENHLRPINHPQGASSPGDSPSAHGEQP